MTATATMNALSIPAPVIDSPPTELAPVIPQPTLVRFSFTGSGALLRKIRRAQELLRHRFPYAQLGEIIDQALDDLLDKRDPDRIIARKDRKNRRPRRQRGALP